MCECVCQHSERFVHSTLDAQKINAQKYIMHDGDCRSSARKLSPQQQHHHNRHRSTFLKPPANRHKMTQLFRVHDYAHVYMERLTCVRVCVGMVVNARVCSPLALHTAAPQFGLELDRRNLIKSFSRAQRRVSRVCVCVHLACCRCVPKSMTCFFAVDTIIGQ